MFADHVRYAYHLISVVYIFHFAPVLGGGGRSYCSVGGKNMMIYKEKREYKGKEGEQREKRVNFTVQGTSGKKYLFVKKCRGQKYPILRKYIPLLNLSYVHAAFVCGRPCRVLGGIIRTLNQPKIIKSIDNHQINCFIIQFYLFTLSLTNSFFIWTRQRTQDDWRYWVFTSIMGHFVHTFAQEVSNISVRDMDRTSIEWIQERMSLQQLRKDAFRKPVLRIRIRIRGSRSSSAKDIQNPSVSDPFHFYMDLDPRIRSWNNGSGSSDPFREITDPT